MACGTSPAGGSVGVGDASEIELRRTRTPPGSVLGPGMELRRARGGSPPGSSGGSSPGCRLSASRRRSSSLLRRMQSIYGYDVQSIYCYCGGCNQYTVTMCTQYTVTAADAINIRNQYTVTMWKRLLRVHAVCHLHACSVLAVTTQSIYRHQYTVTISIQPLDSSGRLRPRLAQPLPTARPIVTKVADTQPQVGRSTPNGRLGCSSV